MILLPIAENAMKHGPGAGHRGGVALSVRADATTLVIELVTPAAIACRATGAAGSPWSRTGSGSRTATARRSRSAPTVATVSARA